MADIELVIKINEDTYKAIQRRVANPKMMKDKVDIAIANGTPLPKDHGRLLVLSEDAVKREQAPLSFSCQKWISEAGLSNATVAIIESDKGESEEES